MNRFVVHYSIDETATAIVEAETEEEARGKFLSGDYDQKTEVQGNADYQVDFIREVV